MSMFNDMDWTKKGNSSDGISNSERASDFAKRFPRGHWEKKISGMERTPIDLKKQGIKSPIS